MSVLPIIKGVSLGAAVGAVCFVVAKSSTRQKRMIKRDASKTVKAFSDVVSDFTSMIR